MVHRRLLCQWLSIVRTEFNTSNTAPLAEITDCCLGDTGSFVMSQLECNCSAGAAGDTTEK